MTQEALKAVYLQFAHALFKRCRAILQDEARAKDAMQETFVRLWKAPQGFELAASKLKWLQRVAERVCFDQLATTARHREDALTPAHDAVQLAPSAEASVEDRDVVMRFIERFDERTRQVALLHYLDGMTREEIAAETGWSRHTVGKKLQFLAERARILRPRLTGEATAC